MKLESDIQSKITTYLKKSGIYHVKIIVASLSGNPDIICCHKGKFIGIELKKDKDKKPTLLQARALKMIRKSGGTSFVARSLQDVKDYFEREI